MQTETMDEMKFFIFNTFRGTSFPAFLTRYSMFLFYIGPHNLCNWPWQEVYMLQV